MAFQTKWVKVTKIISKQEGREDLNEIVEGILEELGLENQLTEEWVLTLQYKELNPGYGKGDDK